MNDELKIHNYDLNKIDAFMNDRYFSNQVNILNQLQYYFKWDSKNEEIVIPRNFELLIRVFGIVGFVKKDKKFAHVTVTNYDDNNIPNDVVAIGFGTSPKSYGTLKNNEDIILCYNNPLGVTDLYDINYFSYEKAQNDISRMYQLINSRNIPMLETDSDQAKDAIFKALEAVKAGKPAVVTTSIFEEIKQLDILDPANIEKMQYLTSYDEALDKNIANHYGASLDIKNKAAQVNTAELKAYDDITTSNYLVAYESRFDFVNRMKEEGFEIDLIVSPIFADEPTEEEIEDPKLLTEEMENEENLSDNEENLSNNEETEEETDEKN